MTSTITPRTFATRRIVHNTQEYEKIANLIKKYGCPVSKVSDQYVSVSGFATLLYFDIPIEAKEAFLKEENQQEAIAK